MEVKIRQMKEMTFDEWSYYGWKQGWVGPPVCYTHDGIPTSDDEYESWGEGNDLCIHVMRLYEDNMQRLSVEHGHSPTQWRASNQGWER